MTNNCIISIIITNYNYSKYLSRAIHSALTQTYPFDRYEVIVIDDGSTDNSKYVIDSFWDIIRSYYFKENVGLPRARNKGIQMSKGKYIIFLDADDYLSRDALLFLSMFLEKNKDWMAVTSDYVTITDKGREISRYPNIHKKLIGGILFRKAELLKIHCFDELFKQHEDTDFFIRFNKTIHYIQLPLYRYRNHRNSMLKRYEERNGYLKLLEEKYGKLK